MNDARAELEMKILQELIVIIRTLRSEAKLAGNNKPPAIFWAESDEVRELIERNKEVIIRLSGLSTLGIRRVPKELANAG